MNQKCALITGITGQDGAVLAEILLNKGYEVHGLRPYSAVPDTARIDHLDEVILHYGDVTDSGSISRLLDTIQPNEIYNMAGMSHVHVSFDMPELTANVNALGPLRILEAIRTLGLQETRFYQASSSEMFGRSPAPQNEKTPMQPCSPYGAAKLYAYWTVRNYREAYGLHASNGILFNHESALRGEEFVTRKITKAIGQIESGQLEKVSLGNLGAQRDWGHAFDYMQGAHQILQHNKPDDYILATGESHSVREFVEKAFAVIGVTLEWKGEGLNEHGFNAKTGQVLVDVDPKLFRPKEVHRLIGDASKAQNTLGWKPSKSFDALVNEMVQADRIVSTPYKTNVAA